MLQALFGNSIAVYLGITVVMTGFAAYMTGQALGERWKPFRHLLVYCLLLGIAARFLSFALFDGELFSPGGYVVGTLTLMLIGTVAFRVNRARRMVGQYPWLYRRQGLFGWRPMGSEPPAH